MREMCAPPGPLGVKLGVSRARAWRGFPARGTTSGVKAAAMRPRGERDLRAPPGPALGGVGLGTPHGAWPLVAAKGWSPGVTCSPTPACKCAAAPRNRSNAVVGDRLQWALNSAGYELVRGLFPAQMSIGRGLCESSPEASRGSLDVRHTFSRRRPHPAHEPGDGEDGDHIGQHQEHL